MADCFIKILIYNISSLNICYSRYSSISILNFKKKRFLDIKLISNFKFLLI